MNGLYDAVIVGGGPAGLSAAIYMARACYRVLVIEKEEIGGQITITSEVVNYPGVIKTSGKELTESMRRQAENFGAEFLKAEVTGMEAEGKIKKLKTTRGEISTVGIILATGANPRSIGFKGEEEFKGRGVAYCATCDGEFFTGMDIFVVGGGLAALEEAVFLTQYGRRVTILVRRDQFSCEGDIVREVMSHPKIEVKFRTEIEEAGGEESLSFADIKNNQTGEKYRYEAEPGSTFGIFVFAGYKPATGCFKDILEISENGYLVTDTNQKTSIDGIYGAGDVCVKELRQVVTAVSDGAVAATSLAKYITKLDEEGGIAKRPKREPVEKKTESRASGSESKDADGFIDDSMKSQLIPLFERFESSILLKLYADGSELSEEMQFFVSEIQQLSPKIEAGTVKEGEAKDKVYPSICICKEDGTETGIEFHAVPGGHEFNSFVVALYNAAGPGQQADPDDMERIRNIKKEYNMKVMVSLSCTMCPELVMASQLIAVHNKNVRAEMYDINHFPELKEQYKIMSVPCLVINDDQVKFGKKNVSELLDILQ